MKALPAILTARIDLLSRGSPGALLLVGALLFSLPGLNGPVRAENWNGWRGPRGDGTSLEKNVPIRWDGQTGENILWKVEVPGKGHASPVVWEDKIFLVTCLEDRQERALLCLDRRSGNTLWKRIVFRAPLETKHRLNSFASSTPITDGKLVIVTFLEVGEKTVTAINVSKPRDVTPGRIVVVAFDLDGNEKWRAKPGEFVSVHGFCSSPVLYKDMVIVNGDHDGDAYLVALDQKSGEIRWKTERENKTRSYVTPIIREIDGRMQMVLSGSKCVASFDPDTGKRHWVIDGPTEQFVASMVYDGHLVFLTGGFPERHILAIRPDGHGNVTDSHIVWRTRRGAGYVPSPIVEGKYFLVVSDSGIASCLDTASGKEHWVERIGQHYSASTVSADGLVWFLSDKGVTKVVRPGPTLDVVAENELGEYCFSSPAISNGRVYIRGEKHLFCVGEEPEGVAETGGGD